MESDLVGTTLGNYTIVEKLGAGGMGVVYLAVDEKLRRRVAIKVLPDAVANDEDRRRRFLREARSAAAVTHPNIATIYAVDERDERVYLVMELVEGSTLREELRGGALPPAEALRIGKAIARGLAKAHENGIVHRDLKPENVMVAKDGGVKILDFGLAKIDVAPVSQGQLENQPTASHVTEAGVVMGTLGYMSPEQALGQAVDARTDLFALGVVLYEMLTGRRPFEGPSGPAVIASLLRDEPTPPSRLGGALDPGVEAAVLRCLRKEPADRFGSVAALLSVLDAGPSMPAPAPSLPPAPGGRRLALGALAAASVIALIAAGRYTRAPAVVADPAGDPVAASSAPAAEATAKPPAATRIVDLPVPKTSVPAAAAAYASGVQALHDDNWGKAGAHFEKAVELDPAMAMAHLRLSMAAVALQDVAHRRASYEKAVGLRAQLDERDAALLEALQPFLQGATQDRAETERRLTTMSERWPRDVEVWMWRGVMRYATAGGLAAAQRAVELDHDDGQSWELLAQALLASGEAEKALAGFERCAKISVDGADCLGMKADVELALGRCGAFDVDVRAAADRNPMYEFARTYGEAGLAGSAADFEGLLAHSGTWPLPPGGGAILADALRARRAIAFGDFTAALSPARRAAAALAKDAANGSIFFMQFGAHAAIVEAAIESGDAPTAQRAASELMSQRKGWAEDTTLNHGVEMSLAIARLAYPAEEPPPAAFAALRRSWIEERLADGASRGQVWSYAWAAPALTAREAEDALAALPEYGAPASIAPITLMPPFGNPEAWTGHVYLLAGRADDAIPHLKAALTSCDRFVSPRQRAGAAFDLGQAYEAKHDKPAACEAYSKVVDQWGNAKPKSVTATAAKARRKALACP